MSNIDRVIVVTYLSITIMATTAMLGVGIVINNIIFITLGIAMCFIVVGLFVNLYIKNRARRRNTVIPIESTEDPGFTIVIIPPDINQKAEVDVQDPINIV